MDLKKLLPSVLSAIVAIAGLMAPQLQSLVSAHPVLSMCLASLASILMHMAPSPMLPKAE